MPNAVNTGFALDMQRKLYRWSLSDKSKIFSDLFNLVCDRRTLMHAWRRLSGNAGSNTPGTDGLTRRKVQGVRVVRRVFSKRSTRNSKRGPTDPNRCGSGSYQSRTGRGNSARWGYLRSRTALCKWP
jgi:hypothetical protein